ncbi:hypothetical protein CLV46_1897 [Diaminobutyricimonas aerilata]|uniref:Uncharacterized protein n=1 Tax=Diaminobutyricimonas aerilata TaxID=1162967 RepID=A0A2M9CKB4_9MICO|nr:hypothetical protein [Diaminobutyricimonas aerilata]PJJ72330.1 hypothetical protein CLV46_1897 [Diaminobutyricimonas aerilata]
MSHPTSPAHRIPGTLSEAQRAEILNTAVAGYVRKGWAAEAISGTQAVLVKTKRIGWFWNLILVLITAGLWLIYVVYRALNRKQKRLVLFVDERGQVHTR